MSLNKNQAHNSLRLQSLFTQSSGFFVFFFSSSSSFLPAATCHHDIYLSCCDDYHWTDLNDFSYTFPATLANKHILYSRHLRFCFWTGGMTGCLTKHAYNFLKQRFLFNFFLSSFIVGFSLCVFVCVCVKRKFYNNIHFFFPSSFRNVAFDFGANYFKRKM